MVSFTLGVCLSDGQADSRVSVCLSAYLTVSASVLYEPKRAYVGPCGSTSTSREPVSLSVRLCISLAACQSDSTQRGQFVYLFIIEVESGLSLRVARCWLALIGIALLSGWNDPDGD